MGCLLKHCKKKKNNNTLIELQKNQDHYFKKEQIEYYLKNYSLENNKQNQKLNFKK